MTMREYPCNSCGKPVNLSMTYCSKCGIKIHVDPDQLVWNLVKVTVHSRDLPMEQREYQLLHKNPFDSLDELRVARRKLLYQMYPGNRSATLYEESPQQQELIFGSHLVYIQYRQGDIESKGVKVIEAYHYTATYAERSLYVGHMNYEWKKFGDFPAVIKFAE